MDKRSFLSLVDRVASGAASREDLLLYNHYYNQLQEGQLEWDEERLGKREEMEKLILEHIDGALGIDKRADRTVQFYRRPLPRVAAVLLVTLAAGWLIIKHDHSRPTRSPQVAPTAAGIADERRPGQATLTLANGNQIILGDRKAGMIAKQGTTQVLKLDDGRLAYRSGGLSSAGEERTAPSNILSTPYGGKYQATLPDGTIVWLNAGSSLKFPTAFPGRERNVELKGEAYFEVAKDAAKPFTVFIRDMRVDVLGTHVDIMGYEDEAVLKTSLLTGSVKVINGKDAVMLKPGQQARLNASGQLSTADHADMGEVLAWKNDLFDFEGADIPSVMRQIARWYNVEVVYKDRIDQHFTGKIERTANITEVLKMLELTEKVHFTVEGRKITVSR